MEGVSSSQAANIGRQNLYKDFTDIQQIKINLEQQPDAVELSSKKSSKKKKIAKTAAIVAGSAAVIAGIAYAAKKGKIQIQNPFKKVDTDYQQGVKKFFDSKGNPVQDVKLIKGKAYNADGSEFSGTLKAMSAKGKQKTFVRYSKGELLSSSGEISTNEGIKRFSKTYYNDKDGNTILMTRKVNNQHEEQVTSNIQKFNNGTKIIKLDPYVGNGFCKEISSSGKLMAEYEYESPIGFAKGKIFDENGTGKDFRFDLDNGVGWISDELVSGFLQDNDENILGYDKTLISDILHRYGINN